jgi:hypothetical protein
VTGVGKRAMSVPISAMIVCAAVRPTPVTASPRSTAAANGAILASILRSSSPDVDAALIDARTHPGKQEGVMVGELPGEGLGGACPAGTQPGAGQLGQPLGITLAVDERGGAWPGRPRQPVEVAGWRRLLPGALERGYLHDP